MARSAAHRIGKFPFATVAVLALSVALTCTSRIEPRLLEALRRDWPALERGELWRAVTPLFVQPDPWPITLSIWATLLVVGLSVERLFGRARWLCLYAAGAVVGEMAGYAWQPDGAGGSIAVAGLLGGLAAWLLLRPGPWFAKTVPAALIVAALISTWMNDIHGLPFLAGLALGALFLWK